MMIILNTQLTGNVNLKARMTFPSTRDVKIIYQMSLKPRRDIPLSSFSKLTKYRSWNDGKVTGVDLTQLT